MSEMLWIILVCATGTFLLRWVPLWHARRHRQKRIAGSTAQRWLEGVGPSAISALFVVSAWGLLPTDERAGRIVMVVLALACVALLRLLRRGSVALPTLAGSVAYGVLSHFQG
ncbi:AzlD domain-containing protein [Stenotrophomonas sp. ISL-67]|uniref:AzlD domain-containing protein n=1 Tax=Stenotrophomonas sp. ISL-67 TaxID=2819171 RepID=UPI00203505EE|nr:AzlD domain-containing protein [Stenotrophomonas sp. ISL-67]